MSNFRDRAREIRAEGQAQRGNFEPHGMPKRVYQFWLDHSTSTTALQIRNGRRSENFCHFWRVVLIWAPMIRLAMGLDRVLSNPVFQIVGGVTAITVITYILTTMDALVMTLLFAAAFTAVLAVGVSVRMLYIRYWNHSWDDKFIVSLLSLLAIAATLIVGYALYVLAVSEGWLALLAVLGGIALYLGGMIGLGFLSDYLSGKRSIAEKAAINARLEYYDEHGTLPPLPVKEPSRLRKFFSGLGDFLILAFQIARVKKWKICPIVKV